MSPSQHALYFRIWNSLCVEQGWYHLAAKEKDAKRRALHLQARCPSSSKDFSNQHFNRFKGLCEALLAGRKFTGTDAADAHDQTRRVIWRIEEDCKKAGLDEAYVVAIARDLTALGNWRDLDLDTLTKLRTTIHNRASKKLGHDTRTTPKRRYALDAVPRSFASANEPF